MDLTPQILCFEDHPDELSGLLPALCEEFHASVTLAESFHQAEAHLQTGSYDLFLLDIEINGERATGIQLAERIRRMPQYTATPILFMSMHTHYSHRLLSTIRHAAFLPKPFTKDQLFLQIGVALELPDYLAQYYRPPQLLLPVSGSALVEIDPTEVSFIQFTGNHIMVQYINGRQFSFNRRIYSFQEILKQIKELRLDSLLRQIYRSIIVNVEQIRRIEAEKNTAFVFLFHDDDPKPLGKKYRENLSEFLERE